MASEGEDGGVYHPSYPSGPSHYRSDPVLGLVRAQEVELIRGMIQYLDADKLVRVLQHRGERIDLDYMAISVQKHKSFVPQQALPSFFSLLDKFFWNLNIPSG